MSSRRWNKPTECGRFQRVFKGRLEEGVAILQVIHITPNFVWRKATLRGVESSNVPCVVQLTSDVVNLESQTILKRRGGMASSFHRHPLV